MRDIQLSMELQVTLTVPSTLQAESAFILPVTVSIYNSATYPVTFLKWDTPFDNCASLLDIFEVHDTKTKQALQFDTIKLSRVLPPSATELEEIGPKGTITKTVDIPGLRLHKGHEYTICTHGIWHGVWQKPLANVTASQLMDLASARGGEFWSNVAIVKVV